METSSKLKLLIIWITAEVWGTVVGTRRMSPSIAEYISGMTKLIFFKFGTNISIHGVHWSHYYFFQNSFRKDIVKKIILNFFRGILNKNFIKANYFSLIRVQIMTFDLGLVGLSCFHLIIRGCNLGSINQLIIVFIILFVPNFTDNILFSIVKLLYIVEILHKSSSPHKFVII